MLSSKLSFGVKGAVMGAALAMALTLGAAHGAAAKDDGHGHDGHGHGKSVHWGYTGDEGPVHWGELAPEFEACAKGKEQSPIDIKGGAAEDLPAIEFGYKPTHIKVINNGHTIQVNYDGDSHITLGGKRYNLLQFHFHAPSEHAVDGKLAPMEVHFVHKGEGGALAVVGVMLAEGEHNSALDGVWANMPKSVGPEVKVKGSIDAAALLPKSRLYSTYRGSLTTPPCTEGVTWLVMQSPTTLSGEQIDQFKEIVGVSNRPVQPLNARTLKSDTK